VNSRLWRGMWNSKGNIIYRIRYVGWWNSM